MVGSLFSVGTLGGSVEVTGNCIGLNSILESVEGFGSSFVVVVIGLNSNFVSGGFEIEG